METVKSKGIRFGSGFLMALFFSLTLFCALPEATAETVPWYKQQRLPKYSPSEDLRPLLKASFSSHTATRLANTFLDPQNLSQASAVWPNFIFLVGEIRKLNGDERGAKEAYRSLVEWAASRPYADNWGGSALAAVALWRWLKIVNADKGPDHKEGLAILRLAEEIRQLKLPRGLYKYVFLEALPQMEEDTSRQLALLAHRIGEKNTSLQLFKDYLSIAGKAKLAPWEESLKKALISAGLASEDHLCLLRGRRLISLGRYDEAKELIEKARKSDDSQVSAKASLHLARLLRIKGKVLKERDQVISLLSSVIEDVNDLEILQRAIYFRAFVHNREGVGRNEKAFLKDLGRLISEFPEGDWTDDALYQLAGFHLEADDMKSALQYYKELRDYRGSHNDWINMGHFKPAMALYSRGGSTDRKEAAGLLKRLQEKTPDGPLHVPSLFWLGRIASESGDYAGAKRYFRRIIKISPYGFYGIRARMHLHTGAKARMELWPDPQTKEDLKSRFQESRTNADLEGSSPYQRRLEISLASGVYSMASASIKRVRERFKSRRLKQIPLGELDKAHLLTAVSLFLSLRQDAVGSKDKGTNTLDRLGIAGALGSGADDWPLALTLITAVGESRKTRRAVATNRQYLAIAYPLVFGDLIKTYAAKNKVLPELLYSVIRSESLFCPTALSPRGALGLFQFLPSVFDILNKRWKLLQRSGAKSREQYLLNPELNISLGARWFKQELLKRYRGKIFFAVMDHNAGRPAVRKWIENWKRAGREKDIEYMVETIRFLETRRFLQRVLTDMIIAEAAGIFGKGE